MPRLQLGTLIASMWPCAAIPLCAADDCAAPSAWFPKTPPVPADFQITSDEECDFYKWAWQSFLWLTQSDLGSSTPRFVLFTTPDELFAHGKTLLMAAPKRAGKMLNLAPRTAKQRGPTSLASIEQAVSHGVLVDQSGHVIYFGTHLNQTFADFVRDHNFTVADNIAAADPSLEFPPGVLSQKSSWKVVAEGGDADRVFTTIADVYPLVTDAQGNVAVDSNTTRRVRVAPLGLHVVGTTVGHPEFIWATFEHNDNAPDLMPGVGPADPVDDTCDYTLYARGTKKRDCNLKAAEPDGPNDPHEKLTLVDPQLQIVRPKVFVCREHPFGGDDDPTDIKSLNESVHQQLPVELQVWKNYGLIGAVWLANPATSFTPAPTFTNDDELEGHKRLANSSMETFAQHRNCFRCHDTNHVPDPEGQIADLPGKKINMSHLLLNAYFAGSRSGD